MDKEHQAIERLRYAANVAYDYYKAPLIITYSGGKDSEVLLALALRAGIDFEAQHNHTTADAPETVYHVRQRFKALESSGVPCTINMPHYKGLPTSMWALIPHYGPPTRLFRWCCKIFKEGNGGCIATGVRWAESSNRKQSRGILEANREHIFDDDNAESRREFETCPIKGKTTINPIIDWSDADVWGFTRAEHLPVNPLYNCGFSRVGCIGCPKANNFRRTQFARYPKYEQFYRRAFAKMLQRRMGAGKDDLAKGWTDSDAVFRWWMRDPEFYGQQRIQGI